MARFRYARRRFYPELDLEVCLNLHANLGLSYIAQASITARGLPGARQHWRDDFWKWAVDRNLDAWAPRYGNRRIDGASVFDCFLKDWRTVADFIVMWVGVDALAEALVDREEYEANVGRQMHGLTASIQVLADRFERLENILSSQALSRR